LAQTNGKVRVAA